MSILDIFGSRSERQIVGQVDCSTDEVPTVFLDLMQSMGMANPKVSTTIASKGVSITKKGNKYTLVLEMFQPPLEITWESPVSEREIQSFINRIARNSKKVCWVNFLNMNNGQRALQFGTY